MNKVHVPSLLVIDDDAALLEALTLCLDDEGYRVQGCLSGNALSGLMEGSRPTPDAIVLDMLLSGENGRLLCERLKACERTRHIPVVLMSAHPNAAAQAAESLADRFIAKPFEVDDLLSTIDDCLSMHDRPTEIPA